MNFLLIENDPLVRDQVKVGLQQFPEFHVTVGTGFGGVNELHTQEFDCVLVGVDGSDSESVRLLQHLRTLDKDVELVVLTQSRNIKAMLRDKARYDIHSVLSKPIEPKDLFDFVGRFQDRHTQVRSQGGRQGSELSSPAPGALGKMR